MEMCLATHTLVEYRVILYFVLRYRKYISNKLNVVQEIWKETFSKKNTIAVQSRRNAIFALCVDLQDVQLMKYIM